MKKLNLIIYKVGLTILLTFVSMPSFAGTIGLGMKVNINIQNEDQSDELFFQMENPTLSGQSDLCSDPNDKLCLIWAHSASNDPRDLQHLFFPAPYPYKFPTSSFNLVATKDNPFSGTLNITFHGGYSGSPNEFTLKDAIPLGPNASFGNATSQSVTNGINTCTIQTDAGGSTINIVCY